VKNREKLYDSLLEIRATGNKGRGIFAKKTLQADMVLETAPVIVMSRKDRDLLDQTLLHDYIFEWQPYSADMCCMALGWIPLYNHSYQSNCEYFMNYDDQTMFVQTVREVAAGEELTINYNGTWNDAAKVWFDVTE
jgi:SET domain-containing protein